MVRKSKINLAPVKRIALILAAASSLIANFLYERHLSVLAYNPVDVSHTIALYLSILSAILWLIFITASLLSRKK